MYDPASLRTETLQEVTTRIKNWEQYLTNLTSSTYQGFEVELVNGGVIFVRGRNSDVSDLDIVHEVVVNDCYKLDRLPLRGRTVFDIGAHIGSFAVLAALQARAHMIVCIEPEPSNLRVLKHNLELNKIKACEVIPLPVYPRKKAYLSLNSSNTGGHRIGRRSTLKCSRCVHCITPSRLSSVIQGFGKRAVTMKIDCEGCERALFSSRLFRGLEMGSTVVLESHKFTGSSRLALDMPGWRLCSLGEPTYLKEGSFQIWRMDKE